jgi:hypothetical protein
MTKSIAFTQATIDAANAAGIEPDNVLPVAMEWFKWLAQHINEGPVATTGETQLFFGTAVTKISVMPSHIQNLKSVRVEPDPDNNGTGTL